MAQQPEPAPPAFDREPKGTQEDKPGGRLDVTRQAHEDYEQPIVDAVGHGKARRAPCRLRHLPKSGTTWPGPCLAQRRRVRLAPTAMAGFHTPVWQIGRASCRERGGMGVGDVA